MKEPIMLVRGICFSIFLLLAGCSTTYLSQVRKADSKPERVQQGLSEHLLSNPKDIGACLALARRLLGSNERDAAVAALDRTLAAVQNLQVLELRASLAPDAARAEAFARKALALDPAAPEALRQLAIALLQQSGKAEEAGRAITKHLELDPLSGTGWQILGYAQALQGFRAEAIRSLERALRVQLDSSQKPLSRGLRDLAHLYAEDPTWGAAAQRWSERIDAQRDRSAFTAGGLPPQRSAAAIPAPLDERPELGVVAETGASSSYAIRSVTLGSMGAAAGFQPGDILVSCNGRAVDAHSDLEDMLRQDASADKITLEVQRGAARLHCVVPRVTTMEILDLAAALLREAKSLHAATRHLEAAERCGRVMAMIGYNEEAAKGQIVNLLEAGSFAEAERIARHWLGCSPKNAWFNLHLGHALMGKGDLKGADGPLALAVGQDPGSGLLAALQGLRVCDLQGVKAARPHLERAVLLGGGGAALTTLATKMDAIEKQENDRIAMALLMGMFAAGKSGGGRGPTGVSTVPTGPTILQQYCDQTNANQMWAHNMGR